MEYPFDIQCEPGRMPPNEIKYYVSNAFMIENVTFKGDGKVGEMSC